MPIYASLSHWESASTSRWHNSPSLGYVLCYASRPVTFVYQRLFGDFFIIVHFSPGLPHTLIYFLLQRLHMQSMVSIDLLLWVIGLRCGLRRFTLSSLKRFLLGVHLLHISEVSLLAFNSLFQQQGFWDPSHFPHNSLFVWALPPLLMGFWPFLLFWFIPRNGRQT